MGNILDMAISQARQIINNGGFEVELTITPTGLDPVVIKGLATKHSQGFTTDGFPVISDNAHCSFAEKDLNDLGITTRSAKGTVTVKNWLVSWVDAIGTNVYTMSEPGPDNTLGIIRVTLTNYTA